MLDMFMRVYHDDIELHSFPTRRSSDLDEWGSVEGLITIEDILEEIVGEIQDEFDEPEAAIEPIGDNTYAIDGRIPIDRKSTRLNSSHLVSSYAVFCLKNKK